MSVKFSAPWQKISGRAVKTDFHVSMRMCRGDNCFHWNEWSFPISFGHWANFFRVFVDRFSTLFSKRHPKISAVLSNLHSTCRQEKLEGKNFFTKKYYTCFHIFGKLRDFFTAFRRTIFCRVVKTEFYVSKIQRNTLTRKNFLEKNAFFSISDRDRKSLCLQSGC